MNFVVNFYCVFFYIVDLKIANLMGLLRVIDIMSSEWWVTYALLILWVLNDGSRSCYWYHEFWMMGRVRVIDIMSSEWWVTYALLISCVLNDGSRTCYWYHEFWKMGTCALFISWVLNDGSRTRYWYHEFWVMGHVRVIDIMSSEWWVT